MGNVFSSSSKIFERDVCNYNCPVCQKTDKLPNLLGRFFIINQTECVCNGCNTVFPKEQFFS